MIARLRLFGFLVAFLGVTALPMAAAAAKYAAIVVDAGSGEVLYARNADRHRYPASLAKMMTIYLTFEALESGDLALDQALTMSKYAARQPASRLGLRPGQTITVEEAILALVTKSANDVAAALAEALGGTERKFAFQMTRAARELGMKRTRFRNASGCPTAASDRPPATSRSLPAPSSTTFPSTIITFPPNRSPSAVAPIRATTVSCEAYPAPTGSRPVTSALPGSTSRPRCGAARPASSES